nr:hypothetical protein [uncultured Halomonas sp.]
MDILNNLNTLIALSTVIIGLACYLFGNRVKSLYLKVETHIGLIFLALKEFKPVSWEDQINQILDKAFGERYFSKRALVVSAIHTSVSGFILVGVPFTLLWIYSSSVADYGITWSGIWYPLVFPFSVLFTNFVWDYLSFSATRALLRKSIGKGIIIVFVILIIDILIASIFGVLAAAHKYLGIQFGSWFHAKPFIKEVLLLQMMSCFITSFSVTLWVWFYLILHTVSGITNYALKVTGVVIDQKSFIDKPLAFISFVLLVIVFIYGVFSAFGIEKMYTRETGS